MRGPHGPRTLVREGVRAIKVSMSCYGVWERLIYCGRVRTDQVALGRVDGRARRVQAGLMRMYVQ